MSPVIVHIARIILGAVFLTTGLNGFFNFMPFPQMPAEAGAFMGAMGETGYFFPLLKTVELVCGILFLSNRLVPLAAILISPVIVQIFAFHVFLAPLPAMLALSTMLGVCNLIIGLGYSQHFSSVLDPRAKPDRAYGTTAPVH